MNNIGDLIKKLRKQKGWSQSHLAQLADINLRTVQRAENLGVLAGETKMAIASAFGLKPEDLSGTSEITVMSNSADTPFMVKLKTGKALADVIGNTVGARLQHDDLNTKEEVDLVGGFLQNIQDYAMIWSDLEPKDIVATSLELSKAITELETAGFLVFGLRTNELFPFPGIPKDQKFDFANLYVMRSSNEKILILNTAS